MKILATYAAAALIGLATPFFVLWLGRTTPVGTDPSFAGVSVVFALAIVSGLLGALAPRHWLPIALALSLPICVLGGITASLLGAFVAKWAKRR
jgi:hypothetical protein